MKKRLALAFLFATLTLAGCGGGGGSAGTPAGSTATTTSSTTATTTTTTTTATPGVNTSVASIVISSNVPTLKADGTAIATVTVLALSSGNASVNGATLTLSATNGVVLAAQSVVTTAAGASFTVMANAADQTNRSSVITASCSGCTAAPATTQISITGASLTAGVSGTVALIVGGAANTLTATVKSVNGAAIANVPVTFASTDPAILGMPSASVLTNAVGIASVAVSGLSVGNASVNVSALGNATTQAYSVALAASSLSITSPANNTAIVTSTPQTIVASAPGATAVTFTSTQGTFGNGLLSQTMPVVANSASATLTATQGGTISITLNDNLLRLTNLVLKASPPVSSVNKILLNSSATSLPISTLTNQSSVTLSATAIYNNGTTDQAVANVPITFSQTGGQVNDQLTPALAFTNSSGIATATFIAGNSASIPSGISIKATVQGTAVRTGTTPSSNDAVLTIGGQALSVAFGAATEIGENTDKTLYLQSYSVQVTDANNNPVANQKVTLKIQPVAFSIGPQCTILATYCSEDLNGNGSLDVGEDGVRKPTTETTTGSCPVTANQVGGTLDSSLTPQNSDGGSVPSTVTTDANGVAPFTFTYLKASAFWIVNKLTATVSSNGTETSKSTVFRLVATQPDVKPICLLPASPFTF